MAGTITPVSCLKILILLLRSIIARAVLARHELQLLAAVAIIAAVKNQNIPPISIHEYSVDIFVGAVHGI